MTCLECAKNLEQALGAVPGVERTEVSYPSKSGTVTVSDRMSRDELLRTVERTGYRAEFVEDGSTGSIAVREQAEPPARKAAPRPGQTADAGGFDYDLLIVGTGGAGTAAAIRASELGASVAIVEGADVVGGTCVNIGCIPSKYLIEAAHHYHTARTAFPGIQPCDPQLAWKEVLRQKREIVETLRQEKYLDVLAAYEGVSLLRGRAKLLGEGRVQVGEQEVRARKVVLATGTSPAMPPIPGLAEAGALDSTTAMEIEDLPESMVVIGAGAIGLELGQAFARFGVRVIVVEALERIVPTEDAELSATLERALKAEDVEIHTGVRVMEVSRDEGRFVVRVQDGSLSGEVRAEQLLVATGRTPNTADLGLAEVGVETDAKGFIRVDEFMRTSNPHVFAAGDVTGGPGYVYVAAYGGGIAAQAALAEASGEEAIRADFSTTPRVTFTDPQVAAVGVTEEEARAAGIHAKVTSLPVEFLPRAIVSDRRQGVIKLVADAASDHLLGAHIVAPNAGDIIGEAVLAVRFGLRVQEVVSTLHPYLTWGEGIKLVGQTFTKDVAKLSCCA
ncbi:MAG: mercury(II) reductase [Gemmatimonadota bacterium]|nr:mercury(II) reductase [Gemmatimonadota bacterium]